ncbi:MAG: flagellar basal body rod protein FlgC [Comamonas sp.]|nr:flagellar basal body rod protein FlgC [Candidatus Comamonas equi]
MGFREISQIAGSAMTAQSTRLNTVASNLANAGSAASSEAEAYKARKPVFAAVMGESSLQSYAARVQVLDVLETTEPVRKAYEPENPLADAEGHVYYSNVNTVAEMTDMMSASRAFETNVEVLGRVRSMQQSLLRLGDNG